MRLRCAMNICISYRKHRYSWTGRREHTFKNYSMNKHCLPHCVNNLTHFEKFMKDGSFLVLYATGCWAQYYSIDGLWLQRLLKGIKNWQNISTSFVKASKHLSSSRIGKKDIEDIGRKCSSGSCYMQWPTCSLWMEVSTVQEGRRHSQRNRGSLPMSSFMFLYKASSTAHSIDIWTDPQR